MIDSVLRANIADPFEVAAPSQVAPPTLGLGVTRPMRQQTLQHMCQPRAPAVVAALAAVVALPVAAAAPLLAVPAVEAVALRPTRQQTLLQAWRRLALATAAPAAAAAATP